jgi:hypothetical protein
MWRGPRGALLTTASLVSAAVLAAACGSATATFHPGAASPAATGAAPGPASSQLAPVSRQGLTWPPFGRDVHIIMPAWLPADPGQVPAVITAKNFLLAFLYAEYRGNTDDRWRAYATASVARALRSDLARPDVTSESFTGTIRFSQMSAFPDPSVAGAVDVSECFDNARSANVGLRTGQVIPDRIPPDQHYYRNTDVLARDASGRWQVVSIYPVVYYPQAKECTA